MSGKEFLELPLDDVNVYLLTAFSAENSSSDAPLNSTLSTDLKIVSVDSFAANTSYQFNWTLRGDVGGKILVSCAAGKNSSYLEVVSDNIGFIGNLSLENVTDHLVEGKEQTFFYINLTDIPFLLENASLHLNASLFTIESLEVFDSLDSGLRNPIPFSFDSQTQTLHFLGEINVNETRVVIVNGSALGQGNASLSAAFETAYGGYNNQSSKNISVIARDAFSVTVTLPSSFERTVPFSVLLNVYNNASFQNFTYPFSDFWLEFDILASPYVTSLSAVNASYNFLNSSAMRFPSIVYNQSFSILSNLTIPADQTLQYLVFFLYSEEGFLRSFSFPLSLAELSGSSGGSSGGSSSGGSSSRSSSSSVSLQSLTNQSSSLVVGNTSLNISLVNLTSGSVNSSLTLGSSENSCLYDVVVKFSKADVERVFVQDREMVLEFLDRVFIERRQEFYLYGLSILKENGISSSSYDTYFKESEGLFYSSEEFFSRSYDFSLKNVDCLSLGVSSDSSTHFYQVNNFCYVLDSFFLKLDFSSSLLLTEDDRSDLDFQYLFFSNPLHVKAFLSQRNVSSLGCLLESDYRGFFTYDDYYLMILFLKRF